MWDIVKGTPQQGYVANPHTPPGSVHNTGCAVDLSVWDTAAKAAVDMGTPYDFFGSKAHPAKAVELWKKGQLSGLQWANRLAFAKLRLASSALALSWHFDCTDGGTARKRNPVIP
jgi:D-alanyl-D-alanine dipeptidase